MRASHTHTYAHESAHRKKERHTVTDAKWAERVGQQHIEEDRKKNNVMNYIVKCTSDGWNRDAL